MCECTRAVAVEASTERDVIDQIQASGQPGPLLLTAHPRAALNESTSLDHDTERVAD